ncbi:hypothetical protein ACQR16_03940 [Bradyrhizobium oligotrophicum]
MNHAVSEFAAREQLTGTLLERRPISLQIGERLIAGAEAGFEMTDLPRGTDRECERDRLSSVA